MRAFSSITGAVTRESFKGMSDPLPSCDVTAVPNPLEGDRGCCSGTGRVQAHDLCLEVEVRRHGRQRSTGGQTAARRERAIKEVGRGSQPGQGYAAVGNPKKLTGLVERRAEVRRLREEFQTSERRVCELMRIPRMSYRYQSRRDNTWLRERLVELAREKPRYRLEKPERGIRQRRDPTGASTRRSEYHGNRF